MKIYKTRKDMQMKELNEFRGVEMEANDEKKSGISGKYI